MKFFKFTSTFIIKAKDKKEAWDKMLNDQSFYNDYGKNGKYYIDDLYVCEEIKGDDKE